MSAADQKLYGVGAEFPSASTIFHAAQKVRDRGFRWWDVHTPFPVHGMDAAMGMGKSWVSAVSLAGAAFGLTLAFSLESIPTVLIYPMIIQGKPYFSLPAFVPIMFEWTVLWCAFATCFGLLLFCFLPRLNHPVFNWERFSEKSSDDGFFIVIEAADPRFSATETAEFLKSIGGQNVTLIHD